MHVPCVHVPEQIRYITVKILNNFITYPNFSTLHFYTIDLQHVHVWDTCKRSASHLCLVIVMLSRLFIAALWSPEGKRLSSWLLFVMSNCEFG